MTECQSLILIKNQLPTLEIKITSFPNIVMQTKKPFRTIGKAFLYFVNILLHHIMPFLKIANNHDDRNNNDTNNDS